jgi:N-acetylglucosamine-6-sulfatase
LRRRLSTLPWRSRALLALLAAPIFTVALLGGASKAAPPNPPNVVMIMTDDQRVADLAFMPQTLAEIGAEGVTFDDAYVSYSLCCPSRATYLTGQYAHNHDVRSNDPSTGGFSHLDGNHTLPLWLQHAPTPYRTGFIGKYLNGYGNSDPTEVPPGWDEWYGTPTSSGFRMFDYDINCQAVGAPPPAADCATLGGTPDATHPGLFHFGHDDASYKTDVEAQLASGFIERNAAAGSPPFFLSIAPIAPHDDPRGDSDNPDDPFAPKPAPKYAGIFSRLGLPRPPAFNERDVSDKPDYVRNRPRFNRSEVRRITARYHSRLETLLSVDDMVSSIVSALSSAGALDDTYIFFTTDNGYMQGEHRIPVGKVVPYEESIRVPFLVRGPGVPAGQHRTQLVSNIDTAPTIAAIGGASPDIVVDGLSLLPAVQSNASLSRPLLFETFNHARNYRGLRVGRWAYFEYQHGGQKELYDLRRDPYELKNLAAQPRRRIGRRRARLLWRLHALTSRLKSCEGGACQVAAPSL